MNLCMLLKITLKSDDVHLAAGAVGSAVNLASRIEYDNGAEDAITDIVPRLAFDPQNRRLLGGELERLSVKQLMAAPYGRIVILHVTIIAGAFATMALGQPIFLLVILIALKIGVDVVMHLREHASIASKQ